MSFGSGAHRATITSYTTPAFVGVFYCMRTRPTDGMCMRIPLMSVAALAVGSASSQCVGQCYCDFDKDGWVGASDLFHVINKWGPCQNDCWWYTCDLNWDCETDVEDLLIVINNWGECYPCPVEFIDLGVINIGATFAVSGTLIGRSEVFYKLTLSNEGAACCDSLCTAQAVWLDFTIQLSNLAQADAKYCIDTACPFEKLACGQILPGEAESGYYIRCTSCDLNELYDVWFNIIPTEHFSTPATFVFTFDYWQYCE